MSNEMSREQAVRMVEYFESVPKDVWDEADSDDLKELLSDWAGSEEVPSDLVDEQVEVSLAVVGRISHTLDREVAVDLITEGELPPVELSDRELEALTGGECYHGGSPGSTIADMAHEAGEAIHEGVEAAYEWVTS